MKPAEILCGLGCWPRLTRGLENRNGGKKLLTLGEKGVVISRDLGHPPKESLGGIAWDLDLARALIGLLDPGQGSQTEKQGPGTKDPVAPLLSGKRSQIAKRAAGVFRQARRHSRAIGDEKSALGLVLAL